MRAKSGLKELPEEFRERVNALIRERASDKAICERVEAETGRRPGIAEVKAWRSRGYRAWLKQQALLEEMRELRKLALVVRRENDDDVIPQAAVVTAAAQLYQLLSKLSLKTLKKKLERDPGHYLRLLGVLVRLAAERLRYRQSQPAGKPGDPTRARKGGLSDECQAEIRLLLKLL